MKRISMRGELLPNESVREPKVALIACMRKLIVVLNTMIARRQKWDSSRYALS